VAINSIIANVETHVLIFIRLTPVLFVESAFGKTDRPCCLTDIGGIQRIGTTLM
jgi:hypothetical protein